MPTATPDRSTNAIDADFVARIVAQVIARLRDGQDAAMHPIDEEIIDEEVIDQKIIDAKTIERLATGSRVRIAAGAIVTPAARDEVANRNITLHRSEKVAALPKVAVDLGLVQDNDPDRGQAITRQLGHRGITSIASTVIASDTPARELVDQISRGKVAAMVTQINDVDRFGSEIRPNVWVLDMKRMNLITAVNTIAAIARRGKPGP